jgi:hypothetical protein
MINFKPVGNFRKIDHLNNIIIPVTLVIALFLISISNDVLAQGWVGNYSNTSLAELEAEGYEFTNFDEDEDGLITNPLRNNPAQVKTPYWLLDENEFAAFSGVRLTRASGNSTITVTISLQKLDGTIVSSETFTVQSANAQTINEFGFTVTERGFYRLVLDVAQVGTQNNVKLVLESLETNLPEQTFTPEQATNAIEIYSQVDTDKLEYYQTEPAVIHFRVYFQSVDEVRAIRRVRYQLVVPDGFKVSNANLSLAMKPGGQGLRTSNTLEDEDIELVLE